MERRIRICDRCKKEIPSTGNRISLDRRYYDLCSECTGVVRHFIILSMKNGAAPDLLAACKYTLEMIQKAFDIMDRKINYESWMNAEIGLNNAKGELQDVITKAEQTGD